MNLFSSYNGQLHNSCPANSLSPAHSPAYGGTARIGPQCFVAAARLNLQNAHNVLVASSSVAHHGLVAKVADLGLSRVLKQHATHRTTQTVSCCWALVGASSVASDTTAACPYQRSEVPNKRHTCVSETSYKSLHALEPRTHSFPYVVPNHPLSMHTISNRVTPANRGPHYLTTYVPPFAL